MDAKEFINMFYQPLGYLFCGVSNDKMWEYAKERAIEVCEILISRHPERSEYHILKSELKSL